MAEKTVISIEVDGVQKSINSVKELKAELKAAQSAALNGDGKAAKRVAELKDKMDDLKDTTKSLQGSGVEKISSSFSLLGQGFKDFDTDKITTGFKGVGSAMKAIPIFLLIEGISYLVENWKELSEGNGLVAKSLQFLGDIFTSITDKIYAFTDAIGLTNTELDKRGEAITSFAEKSNTALNEQTAAFDRQIAVAKVSGKNTVELEKQKQQAIIDTNLLIAKQIEAFVRAGGELDDEKKKQLTASLDFIKGAKVQQYVIEETDKNNRKELKIKEKEEFNEIELKGDATLKQSKLIEKEIELQELMGVDEKYNQINHENLKAWNEKERLETIKKNEENANLVKNSLQSTQQLTDIFFNYKIAKATKGSAEELALAKKQFNVNKALQLGLAVIDGYKSISASLASSPVAIGAVPNPAGIASLAFAAISTAATVAKIASAKFDGGSIDTGGVSVGAPSISSGGGSASPNITPTALNPTTTTTFTGNKNNQYQPIKAFVTESDIRHSSQRIDTAISQSTF